MHRHLSALLLCTLIACASSEETPPPTAGSPSSAAGSAGAPAGGAAGAGGGAAGEAQGGQAGGAGAAVSVKTTAEARLVPRHPRGKPAGPNPSTLSNLASYPDDYGALDEAPGEPHQARMLDGSAAPAPGPNARRLVRFVHLADLQLADDETPVRLASFDAASEFDAAARPQDANLCHMLGAAVRTANALHERDPFDFLLLGGDNIDSAQKNELSWALAALSGGEVNCDSGDDDDPVKGPGNDGKDPFVSEGLKMPWKWVTGNHDVLVQGTLPVDAGKQKQVVGTRSVSGTRNWASGGVIEKGDFVVADAGRALLDRKALMAEVSAHGDGHGLGEPQRQSGKAFYSFDVEGTPLRFMVLDTGSETGGSSGMLHQADVDAFVRPALDEAKAQGKLVILSSHHAADTLTSDGGAFGKEQPDAVLPDAWKALIGGYDNVVFSVVAHTHTHRVQAIVPAGARGYWELMTGALADFPHQMRVVEVWDQDNGHVMMKATCVDLMTAGDPVAAEGVRLGTIDYVSGYLLLDGPGAVEDRNVELHVKKPGG